MDFGPNRGTALAQGPTIVHCCSERGVGCEFFDESAYVIIDEWGYTTARAVCHYRFMLYDIIKAMILLEACIPFIILGK